MIFPCAEAFCDLVRIPLKNGLMSLDLIESLLDSQKIDFSSINIASNVSGIIAPYAQISNILRQKNIDIAFDLAALISA